MSEKMDPIKRDKIVTYAVVALVAIDMIAMGVLVGLNVAGSVSMETMLVISTILSLLMFAIIAGYIFYSYKAKDKIIAYKEKLDSMEKEDSGENSADD